MDPQNTSSIETPSTWDSEEINPFRTIEEITELKHQLGSDPKLDHALKPMNPVDLFYFCRDQIHSQCPEFLCDDANKPVLKALSYYSPSTLNSKKWALDGL